MKKNILITGGAGYIGSQVSHDLIKRGFKVFIIDNLSTGSLKLVSKKSKFYKLDIKNTKSLKKIIIKEKINTIIHLASSLSVVESSKEPLKYFENNVVGTISLMNSLVNTNVKNFIFSSTSAIYGNSKLRKISENNTKSPISNYAKSKLICEDVIKYYCNNYNINFSILRYFNVAGADLENKIGCLNEIGQLFKNISKNIVQNKSFVNIYGKNYPTKDGTCVRDYIHVKDISLIHLNCLNYISKKNKSLELNCGYGKGYSVLDIVKTFERVSKKRLKLKFLNRRDGDTTRAVCDTKLMNDLIKFKPKFNSITKIAKDSLDWEFFIKKKIKDKF